MPSVPARRAAAAVLALALTAAGIALLLHPLTALDLLALLVAAGLVVAGAHELVTGRRHRDRVIAAALVLAGVAAALWPVWTQRAMVVTLAAVLVTEGAVRLRAPRTAGRVATGVSLALLGALALVWPDVATFALAYLAGLRLLLAGARAAGYAAGVAAHPVRPPRRWGVPARRLGVAAALAATIAASVLTGHAAVTTARPDAFYDPPAHDASTPGTLLRVEPFAGDVPPGARSWRILYTTTDTLGRAVVASGLVTAPDGDDAHPVIAWSHGTTGFARHCAPSLRRGAPGAGGTAAFAGALDRGWAVVATDYAGMGTRGVQPYLIGQGEARSVLDAVRAARGIDGLELADDTVAWGHSQGGHAALWTAILQPRYAPDVPLSGVAAVSPVSDPATFLRDLQTRPVGTVFVAYALAAYDAVYADVDADDHVRAAARIPIDQIADRCLRARSTTSLSLYEADLMADRFVRRSLFSGDLGRRLRENAATDPIDTAVFIGQGSADRVVTRSLQDEYVAGRCADGQSLEYRTYDGYGHRDVVAAGSPFVPKVLAWTAARFAGAPPTPTC